jgi:hypothetical protein
MPTPYTRRLITSGSIVTPDDLRADAQDIGTAFNSGIDGHNLPCASVSVTKIKDREYSTTALRSTGVFSHMWAATDQKAGTSSTYDTLDASFKLRTAEVTGHIINLVDQGCAAAERTLTGCRDGILTGVSVVDLDRRFGYNAPGYTVRGGEYQWCEVVTFLDGLEISTSDWIYARRYTVCDMWSWPISAGTHTLEIKLRVRTDEIDSANLEYDQLVKIAYCDFQQLTNHFR